MRVSAKSLERRFSFERLLLLVRNRLYEETPAVLIGAAIIAGLNALSLVFAKRAFFNIVSAGIPHGGLWVMTITLGGLLLAGSSLKAMHDGRSQTEWILLPATCVEKYAAAVVDIVIAFPILTAAGGVALSGALSVVEVLIGGPGNPIWLPGIDELKAWGGYAIAATVFIAGSSSFRKAAFLKTSGIVLGFCFLFALAIALLIAHFVCGGWENGISFVNGRFISDGEVRISERAVNVMQTALDIAIYAFLPIMAILFGAAKVSEKEAKDEVQ